MILKIISLFLIGIAVLAMFGKLRAPQLRMTRARKCRRCGAHKIGKGPCACEKRPS